jgi:hypothetical protein
VDVLNKIGKKKLNVVNAKGNMYRRMIKHNFSYINGINRKMERKRSEEIRSNKKKWRKERQERKGWKSLRPKGWKEREMGKKED